MVIFLFSSLFFLVLQRTWKYIQHLNKNIDHHMFCFRCVNKYFQVTYTRENQNSYHAHSPQSRLMTGQLARHAGLINIPAPGDRGKGVWVGYHSPPSLIPKACQSLSLLQPMSDIGIDLYSMTLNLFNDYAWLLMWISLEIYIVLVFL